MEKTKHICIEKPKKKYLSWFYKRWTPSRTCCCGLKDLTYLEHELIENCLGAMRQGQAGQGVVIV